MTDRDNLIKAARAQAPMCRKFDGSGIGELLLQCAEELERYNEIAEWNMNVAVSMATQLAERDKTIKEIRLYIDGGYDDDYTAEQVRKVLRGEV